MKIRYFAILLILLFVPSVLATDDIVLSFMGAHTFGENPVKIVDNSTGEILVIANTSSQYIALPSDGDYILRVEPAGLTDALNSPDWGLTGVMSYVERNPIGIVVFAVVVGIIIAKFRR